MVAGSIPLKSASSPFDQRDFRSHVCHELCRLGRREGVADAGDEGRIAVSSRHDIVREHLLLDRLRLEVLNPSASVAMKATSAIPIIRAAAVAAVLPGVADRVPARQLPGRAPDAPGG